MGKTKRGNGTKIMAITNGGSLPLSLHVTSASPHESQLVEETLWRLHTDDVPERLIGDKAYGSDALDALLDREYGIELIAPNKRNRKRRTQDGRPLRRYKRRWVVERFFSWLFSYRRIKVRYEVKVDNFLGMVQHCSNVHSLQTIMRSALVTFLDELLPQKFMWKGHRIFAIDGSKINCPHALINAKYKKPTKSSHYPKALVTSLFRLKIGITYDFNITRDQSEIDNAMKHLQQLTKGDVVIYDRYFISQKLIEKHKALDINFVFRCKEKSTFNEIVSFAASKKVEDILIIRSIPFGPGPFFLLR